MLRDGGAGDLWKTRGDLAGGKFAIAHQSQDGDAARLAEGVEDGGVAHAGSEGYAFKSRDCK